MDLLEVTEIAMREVSNETTSELVGVAKKLISDASALVDSVESVDLPAAEAKSLHLACGKFSSETVYFIHAARGKLFDSSNVETRDRFITKSCDLDKCLDDLLDIIMDLMVRFPEAKVVTKPVSAASSPPTSAPSSPRRPPPPSHQAPPSPPPQRPAQPQVSPQPQPPTQSPSKAPSLVLQQAGPPPPLPKRPADSKIDEILRRRPSDSSSAGDVERAMRGTGGDKSPRGTGDRSPRQAAGVSQPPSTTAPLTTSSGTLTAEGSRSPPPPRRPSVPQVVVEERPPAPVQRPVSPRDNTSGEVRKSIPRAESDLSIKKSPTPARRGIFSQSESRLKSESGSVEVEDAPKSPRFMPRELLAGIRDKVFDNSTEKLKSFRNNNPKLHQAVASGDIENVKKILSKKDNSLNQRNTDGETALQVALKTCQEVIALLLISSGADLNDPDLSGAKPLQAAALSELYDACSLMVEKGANVDSVNVQGATLIETLFRNCPNSKGLALIVSSLEKGSSVRHRGKFGETYLHSAAANNWLEAVEPLLKQGAELNAKNAFGETALHKASRVGNVEMVKLLLRVGADETIVGDNGPAVEVASLPEIKALFKVTSAAPPMVKLIDVDTSASALEDLAPLRQTRARAVTKAVEKLQNPTDEISSYFRDLEQLDSEVKKLAYRGSKKFDKVPGTEVRDGVFEKYDGAMFELETGRKGCLKLPPLVLDTDIEPYRQKFFGRKMFHFATRSWQKGEIAVISVLTTPDAEKGTYSALLVSSSGEQTLDLSFRGVEEGSGKSMKKQLETSFTPGKKWTWIQEKMFAVQLLSLETAHSRNANCYRFGVVFGKADQKTEAEMFLNREGSPEFEKFLQLLGEKIELRGWSGYSGGLNQEDCDVMPHTYYAYWQGLEIVLHISTWMTPEQQRRLIGNDIGLIYFQPHDASFRVAMRGNVNSVAAVVSPIPQSSSSSPSDVAYKVGVFRRGNIRAFDPPLPEDATLSASSLRDFLFTKMVNGTLAAHRSPPLSHLHARVFKNALEELLAPIIPPK